MFGPLYGQVSPLGYTRRKSFAKLVLSYNPVQWYQFNEASGTVGVNYGSFGTAFNQTYSGVTLGQPGLMGNTSALFVPGNNSITTIPAGAYNNFTVWTMAFLVKPLDAGGGFGAGSWFADQGVQYHARYTFSINGVFFQRGTNGGTVQTQTTTGTDTNWAWMFFQMNQATDYKCHIFKLQNNVLAEYAYSTLQAGVGALNDLSANTMHLGNEPGLGNGYHGYFQEYFLTNSILTSQQMTALNAFTKV